ncbi:MAG: hypothetical protein FJ288_16240, partial [Planctomycetes bacterium]|nr:hypothetical protein [Planctomycetota bacterium]
MSIDHALRKRNAAGPCILLFALCVFGSAAAARGGDLFFDLGTVQSEVWPGFTRVTAAGVLAEGAAFGWRTKDGLRAYARAYKEPVENKSRGSMEPPPIWTNPVTEDCIVGSGGNAFLIKAAPGEYEIYVVCGTSEAFRNQFFDFTVRVGSTEQRVQLEGGYQFRSLRFRTSAGGQPLAVEFQPRSKWVCSAVLAWPAADGARVEKDVIAPLEEWTYRLPPEQWAKWKADAEPGTGPMPPLTDEDRRRGFVVYSRHYLECVYPHARPRPEELRPVLRLFACPGECEPANFIVLPLRGLSDARVVVSDIGPVTARDIDVRKVRYQLARPNYRVQNRYRVVPDILEPFRGGDLAADENARFWLTVHVPGGAPPGRYAGRVEFTCAGGRAAIPLELRILPIRLRDDPDKIFGIYYRHPYDLAAGADDEISREHFRRRAELEHADMAAHGTRNVTLTCSSPPADAEGRFKFNWDLLAAKLDLWRKHEFRGPIVMSINTGGVYQKHVKESYGSHLLGVKDPPDAFGAEITAMVKAIEAERKARGWPEFLYYPVDEPGTDAASVNFMVKVLAACKAAGVRTYVTADPTHEQFHPLRPHVDVWCTQPFAPDRETVLTDSRARGVQYWCYPNHVSGENDHTPVAGARMTYGFGFWRSGFRTLIPWIYSSSSGDPLNYLDGSSQDFFNRHEPDGTPMPVVLWEAYREGYDDYRYVYTLERLIAEAKESGRPAARTAAAAAEKELQAIWNAVRVQPKYKYDNLWSPAEFDVYR